MPGFPGFFYLQMGAVDLIWQLADEMGPDGMDAKTVSERA